MATGTAKIGVPAATLSNFLLDEEGGDGPMNPLGDNLLAWLVLAFGGAMAVGTLVALVRPPDPPRPTPGKRPAGDASSPARQIPLARAVVFIAVGGIAAIWALASLLSG
jgi:hypothetical protein